MESKERARGLAAYSAIGEVGRNNREMQFGFSWPPPLLNLPPTLDSETPHRTLREEIPIHETRREERTQGAGGGGSQALSASDCRMSIRTEASSATRSLL